MSLEIIRKNTHFDQQFYRTIKIRRDQDRPASSSYSILSEDNYSASFYFLLSNIIQMHSMAITRAREQRYNFKRWKKI